MQNYILCFFLIYGNDAFILKDWARKCFAGSGRLSVSSFFMQFVSSVVSQLNPVKCL